MADLPSRTYPSAGRGGLLLVRIARWALAVITVLFGVETFAGVMRLSNDSWLWQALHRKTWHLMALAALPTFGLSVAAFISSFDALRRARLAGRILITFLIVALMFHTGFTGYLGPSAAANIDKETLLRFWIIHQGVEPTLLGAMLVWWWLLFRRP